MEGVDHDAVFKIFSCFFDGHAVNFRLYIRPKSIYKAGNNISGHFTARDSFQHSASSQ